VLPSNDCARGIGRLSGLIVVLLALACLQPASAFAQEWHELYVEGVGALRSHQGQRAAELLRRAIEKRPQAGVNVPTYGTNFEPRYFPYLRLAEAYLLLEAYEDAKKTLETSARLGAEPAEERAGLETRVRLALEAARPSPDPTPAPGPTPAIPAAATPAPPPIVATPSVEVVPAPATASPLPSTAFTLPPPRPSPPTPSSSAVSRPTPSDAAATIDVTSHPAAAQVFLDDEPVGRTDPQTGRLRLTGLTAGRHRVRLSSEGRDDVIRELEVAGKPLAFDAELPERRASSATSREDRPYLRWSGVAVLLSLLALFVVLWIRSFARPATVHSARSTPSIGSDRGTDESFPILFGDYRLIRRIGKGGMACVYEAERRGEPFAIKRPLSGFLDDPRFRERFLREAELGRALHHPNIIRIFDRGQVGDTPYFAMEIVDGETLRARLDREGRLDPALAARIVSQVAEALDYAHNKGVIHRDLKPSNIMLERSGGLKVMDYGIARAQNLEGLTTTGAFLGTPNYAAPETIESTSQPRSDLYSLGVVFFEMLTGSLPFRGDTAFVVLRSHCLTPPPAPSSLNFALSKDLDRIVLRLLSKEPLDRPTAEELLNELSEYRAEAR
jgi:Protein kinase domain/PEGA domain